MRNPGLLDSNAPYFVALHTGYDSVHSFQLVLKEKGVRKHKFGDFFAVDGKSTLEVKELAYIALRGTLSESDEEKRMLRNLYRELKSNT